MSSIIYAFRQWKKKLLRVTLWKRSASFSVIFMYVSSVSKARGCHYGPQQYLRCQLTSQGGLPLCLMFM